MKIDQAPSPNFNARKHNIDMLVLHYTGMETGQAALDRMRDPEASVSAHYMVWEDRRIVQLVDETNRAWHAGVSRWQGDEDLNSRSIGIEIVNGGHDWPLADGTLPPFPTAQIQSVISLCQAILSRWDIPSSRIVGHSDIAPDRKQDPGEHFPWEHLAQEGIGFWPVIDPLPSAAHSTGQPPSLIGKGLGAGDRGKPVMRLHEHLATIGYPVNVTEIYDAKTETVVKAFQRRWVPDRVTGGADLTTLQKIGMVADLSTT